MIFVGGDFKPRAFHNHNSPLDVPPCGRSTDGSNVDNSSPVADCNSRSDVIPLRDDILNFLFISTNLLIAMFKDWNKITGFRLFRFNIIESSFTLVIVFCQRQTKFPSFFLRILKENAKALEFIHRIEKALKKPTLKAQ